MGSKKYDGKYASLTARIKDLRADRGPKRWYTEERSEAKSSIGRSRKDFDLTSLAREGRDGRRITCYQNPTDVSGNQSFAAPTNQAAA